MGEKINQDTEILLWKMHLSTVLNFFSKLQFMQTLLRLVLHLLYDSFLSVGNNNLGWQWLWSVERFEDFACLAYASVFLNTN